MTRGMIEKAAIELGAAGDENVWWHEIPPWARREYREDAKRVLTAALGDKP